MPSRSLVRGTAASFALAGTCLALWGVLHPWDHVTGPQVGQSTQWIVAHSLHFVSGIALLWAISGLAVLRLPHASRFGTAAAAVWFLGAALWTGTGMITAFIWPTLARHAPQMTELNGPVFSPPHPVVVVTNLVFCLGAILTAAALLRAGAVRLAGAAMLALGAAILLVPPHPVGPEPWSVFVAGAVLTGFGTGALARAVPRLAGLTAASPPPPRLQPAAAAA